MTKVDFLTINGKPVVGQCYAYLYGQDTRISLSVWHEEISTITIFPTVRYTFVMRIAGRKYSVRGVRVMSTLWLDGGDEGHVQLEFYGPVIPGMLPPL